MDEMLTVSEVIKILKVDRTTFYRLIKKEGIPAFKVGQEWRIMKGDLEKWIAEKKRASMLMSELHSPRRGS